MPKYDFHCNTCEAAFSEILPMHLKDLPACPACGQNGAVRKIIRPPVVHFKGGGFYKNDSTPAAKPVSATAKEATPTKETKPAEAPASTETKTEAKPVEKKTET